MNKKILLSSASIVLMAGMAAPVLAQVEHQPKTQSGLRRTMRLPDDPMIPAMADLTPKTAPREFVESFLISMMRETGEDIYDHYLHARFQEQVSQDVFAQRMKEMMQVLGPIEKIGVVYLRQENGDENWPDRGYADYAMAFQRDPRVAVRVQFERSPEEDWKVTSYNVTSVQLDRFYRSRAAATDEDGASAAGDEANDDAETPPDH